MNSVNAKPGVLLVNLGTPDSPAPRDVARYLRQFLMDPLVIDLPFLPRWFVVNAAIAPFRSHSSGKLYEKVWTEEGAPLLKFHRELGKAFQERYAKEFHTEIAMRYGRPSIEEGMRRLVERGATRLIVAPLYPQYSLSATESAHRETRAVAARHGWNLPLTFVDPFFNDPGFVRAFAERVKPHLADSPDWVLFSFHGLPEAHVKKTDPSGTHCLASAECCDKIVKQNVQCYRAHCYATANAIAAELEIHPDSYGVGFQSRLGREPWIRPYSDEWYALLPKQDVKRLLVVCPSFVADCLETLEEVSIRGLEAFRKAGGEELILVPSLNAEPSWVAALGDIIRRTDREFVAGMATRSFSRESGESFKPELVP